MPKEIYYDAENPKYRCWCCGRWHVKEGAMCIFLMNLIGSIVLAIVPTFMNRPPIAIILAILSIIITFLAFGSGVYGIKKEKPKWLIPALIVLAGMIVYAVIESLYTYYYYLVAHDPKLLFDNKDYRPRTWFLHNFSSPQLAYLSLILRILIGVAFNFWFFLIVYRCFQYLNAKTKADNLPPHLRAV